MPSKLSFMKQKQTSVWNGK